MWAFGRAESSQDINNVVVNGEPHEHTPRSNDTAAIWVDLQVLYGRRCKVESAPWTVRGAAPAPSPYMVYFLTVASLLDALSYTPNHQSVINPTLMRLIMFSFLLTQCERGVDAILWWLLTNVVDNMLIKSHVEHNRQYQYAYWHKGIKLLMQTRHIENGNVFCVNSREHLILTRLFHTL